MIEDNLNNKDMLVLGQSGSYEVASVDANALVKAYYGISDDGFHISDLDRAMYAASSSIDSNNFGDNFNRVSKFLNSQWDVAGNALDDLSLYSLNLMQQGNDYLDYLLTDVDIFSEILLYESADGSIKIKALSNQEFIVDANIFDDGKISVRVYMEGMSGEATKSIDHKIGNLELSVEPKTVIIDLEGYINIKEGVSFMMDLRSAQVTASAKFVNDDIEAEVSAELISDRLEIGFEAIRQEGSLTDFNVGATASFKKFDNSINKDINLNNQELINKVKEAIGV
jgi:hypothetical protein